MTHHRPACPRKSRTGAGTGGGGGEHTRNGRARREMHQHQVRAGSDSGRGPSAVGRTGPRRPGGHDGKDLPVPAARRHSCQFIEDRCRSPRTVGSNAPGRSADLSLPFQRRQTGLDDPSLWSCGSVQAAAGPPEAGPRLGDRVTLRRMTCHPELRLHRLRHSVPGSIAATASWKGADHGVGGEPAQLAAGGDRRGRSSSRGPARRSRRPRRGLPPRAPPPLPRSPRDCDGQYVSFTEIGSRAKARLIRPVAAPRTESRPPRRLRSPLRPAPQGCALSFLSAMPKRGGAPSSSASARSLLLGSACWTQAVEHNFSGGKPADIACGKLAAGPRSFSPSVMSGPRRQWPRRHPAWASPGAAVGGAVRAVARKERAGEVLVRRNGMGSRKRSLICRGGGATLPVCFFPPLTLPSQAPGGSRWPYFLWAVPATGQQASSHETDSRRTHCARPEERDHARTYLRKRFLRVRRTTRKVKATRPLIEKINAPNRSSRPCRTPV